MVCFGSGTFLCKYQRVAQTKTPLERGASLLSKQSIKTKIFKLLAQTGFRYRRLFTDKFIAGKQVKGAVLPGKFFY